VSASSKQAPGSGFPFTAVAGQESFKLALILAAVNPAIGGVLVSGPRGSAKSTLARGFADVIADDSHFVTLPLGASEEMLVGTLDLQQILDDKKVAFHPGLLAKAHEGVLYVDEVNLLPDNLVDLLLDVSASGVNCIERDGISHSHESRFILLGTMNPDEGELRPQLQDRFGLSVELSGQHSVEERMQIVRLREAFELSPEKFIEEYGAQQKELSQSIQQAKAKLAAVTCDDSLREVIAERCMQAQVEGLRADIVWLRAATAHAALKQRGSVNEEDINAVEELVLCHRRKAHSDNNSQSNNSQNNPPPSSGHCFKRPDDSRSDRSQQEDSKHNGSQQEDSQQNRAEGDWGSMEAVQQKTIESFQSGIPLQSTLPVQKKASYFSRNESVSGSKKKRADNRELSNKGRHVISADLPGKRINWFSTLLANTGWPIKQWRFQRPKAGQSVLHLILLDTSASTLLANGFAKAKSTILEIAQQAYLDREQLSIVGFGNQKVETLLPGKRAPKQLREWLDGLPAAGGTPMREVIQHANQYQQSLLKKNPGLLMRTYLITDGKTTQSCEGLGLKGDVCLIDIEQSAVKRGRGKTLAQQLNAEYFVLPA